MLTTLQTLNATVAYTDVTPVCNNTTGDCGQLHAETNYFERVVKVIVPIIFGCIVILGFVGNLLVIIVVTSNKQMRNTTNLLIINLAIADLSFIIICVPFTGLSYAMPSWPFGHAWCKISQYMVNVTAYESVYTLVLMSLDRYLAVVHPIRSMTIRTERNAYIFIILSWAIFLALNIPILVSYGVFSYEFKAENRSACMNLDVINNNSAGKIFYGNFFAFAYVLPLALVCILYGLMLKRLLYGVVPGGNQSSESIRSKKRVTRMVVIVVAIFAICWMPIQVILMIQYFGKYPDSTIFISIQIASNCLAYMNSCVNPILYAFLSDNFRKSFRKVLCYGTMKQRIQYDFERTTARGTDVPTKSTALLNDVDKNQDVNL